MGSRLNVFSMLPWRQRLYFWSIHGIFVEVAFTSLYELCSSGGKSLALRGQSSLWSFLIYGLGTFFLAESIYFFLIKHRVNILLRLLVYIVVTYCWEFCCGIILRSFGANSWDYSSFQYNIMGVVTLEYLPFWVISSLGFEYIISLMEQVDEIPLWKKTKKF